MGCWDPDPDPGAAVDPAAAKSLMIAPLEDESESGSASGEEDFMPACSSWALKF